MKKENICEKIFELLKMIIQDESMLPKTFEEDFGSDLDSIRFVMLIVEIENEFHIEIDDDDFEMDNISTINNLADIVIKYVK